MVKGVDVSSYQGMIDWKKAKGDGVSFAILRSILKNGSLDSAFNRNYSAASELGIPLGVYKYSYALTVDQAKIEAKNVVKAIAGRKFDLGVWLDLEDKSQRALSKNQLTAIINAFKGVIEAAGYQFGIYCNLDWYKNVIDVKKFDVPYWIARYPSTSAMKLSASVNAKYKPSIKNTLWGWQYSSKGRVAGISGYCDINECYVGVTSSVTKKSVEDVAKEVIAGKWGNGEDRKTRLTQAGYEYKAVQAMVNKLLK